ncbi:MAG: TIGR02466 family protein [Henriciella sp.]|nr:TIGR02466 family protein [Henriciella sp.]
MSTRSLFPTKLHQTRLPDGPLIEELEAACWMLEDGDAAGHAWCEREGYPGYTSYASLNDLPDRAPAFSELINVLDKAADQFAKCLHWDLGTARLTCDSLWVNILGEGGHHSGHIHPGSVLSGTCYIAMPPGSGDLKLEDPRLGLMMAAPQLLKSVPETENRFFYVSPRAGDVLMWESWLRHEVISGSHEDPRISVSFNYSLTD